MAKLLILVATFFVACYATPLSDYQQRIDPNLSWRIVGGSNATEGAYPYQISLRGRTGSHTCGGSILDQNTILTAAHCVDGASASSLSVVVGSNKLNSGGVKHQVSAVRAHRSYNSFAFSNDIAILKLATNIELTASVQPVALETEDVGAGVSVVLSGWGRTSYPGNIPNDLQQINLLTISNSDCKARHPIFPPVRNGNVCTLTQKGEGACHGDSGGPLVGNGKQVGVVSWGRPCAVGYPDVFTRVSAFAGWISENRN